MQLLKVHRTFPKLKQLITRRYAQALQREQDEYTDQPNYPPILDMTPNGKKKRERETTRQNIKNINTVEEKQIALNMPRYYGWECVMLNEDKIPYNAMPLVQYYTRTHFKPVESLPDVYQDSSSMADTVVQEIKSQIEDCIVIENEGIQYVYYS